MHRMPLGKFLLEYKPKHGDWILRGGLVRGCLGHFMFCVPRRKLLRYFRPRRGNWGVRGGQARGGLGHDMLSMPRRQLLRYCWPWRGYGILCSRPVRCGLGNFLHCVPRRHLPSFARRFRMLLLLSRPVFWVSRLVHLHELPSWVFRSCDRLLCVLALLGR